MAKPTTVGTELANPKGSPITSLPKSLEVKLNGLIKWFMKKGNTELSRWLQKDTPLTTPEMVLAFQLNTAVSLAADYFWPENHGIVWQMDQDHSGSDRIASGLAAEMVLDAHPYLWSIEMWDAVTNLTVPPHETNSLDLRETQFHVPEVDLDMGKKGGFAAMLCFPVRHLDSRMVIQRLAFFDRKSVLHIDRDAILAGKTYPDDMDGEAKEGHRQIAAMLSFIRSPYLVRNQERPKRGYRHGMERSGRPDDRLVTFTYLRHPKSEQESNGTDAEARAYRYRWLVAGHIRNQYYPSLKDHRLIWIDPYVKGPDGAPMKPRVFKVVR